MVNVIPTWNPIVATVGMLLGGAIAYLIVLGSRRIVGSYPSEGKNETYACGEEPTPEESHPDSEGFYSPIKSLFRNFYENIRPGHSGDVSSYLIWITTGLVVIVAWLILIIG